MAVMITQAEYWNSEAAQTWVREAIRLDPMLAPLGRLAMAALAPQAGETVLDIGCGAGATSRDLAALGAKVIGVDVSKPLIAAAMASGGGPDYVAADAGLWRPAAPADALFSRFGVMFFEDPPAAFENLRACLKPGGRLAFVCWGPMTENAWAIEPVVAALPHLTTPPEHACARRARALCLRRRRPGNRDPNPSRLARRRGQRLARALRLWRHRR
jgi:SAM-dependent methyltransferase